MVKQKAKVTKTKLSYVSEDDKLFKKLVIHAVEIATGRKKLERLYDALRYSNPGPDGVWDSVIKMLRLDLKYDHEKLLSLPRSGPTVFIANHPFGVVDGLVFGYLIAQLRQDFSVLVNEVLYREEMLKKYLLPIDFRDNKAALQTNINTRQTALERLKAGQAVAIFPAGGVATSPKPFWGKADDLDWKNFVLKLVRQTDATVIPLYFEGQNSRLFQMVSHISMNLRLSLLLHEVKNKIGREISINIGEPIPSSTLNSIKNKQELLQFLRTATYQLANQ